MLSHPLFGFYSTGFSYPTTRSTLPLLSRCSTVDLLIWQMRKNCSLFITPGTLSQLTGNTSICNTSKIDFRRLEALFCGVWPSPDFSLLSSRISLQNREKCRFEPTFKKACPARLSERKSLISSGFRRVRGLQKRPQNGHPRHSCIKDSKSSAAQAFSSTRFPLFSRVFAGSKN